MRPVMLGGENGLIACVQSILHEQEGSYEIILKARDWDAKQLFGMLERFQKRAEITYSRRLNECWTRYVQAKELSHLLIDDSHSQTTDPVSLVESLILDIEINGVGVFTPVDSERMAAIMAVELLVPHEERAYISELLSQNKGVDDIALIYKTPAKVIELCLSDKYSKLVEDVMNQMVPK